MKRCLLLLASAILLATAPARASNLQITLSNSFLELQPGGGGGWFAALSDPLDLAAGNFILITGSSFDVPCQGCAPPSPTLGSYSDAIGNIFVVLAPTGNCCGDPQIISSVPIGFFQAALSAPSGITNGFLEIDYSIFSADPNDPNFNPNTQTVSTGVQAFAAATVDIAPEPGTWGLTLIAAIAFAVIAFARRPASEPRP